VKVQSPTGGKVLRVVEESERVVSAGAPLVELSNPSKLELVIELLSTDAVKVSPGALVLIEGWGGREALDARVRLIEPSAFTKVSALGIEVSASSTMTSLGDPSMTIVSIRDFPSALFFRNSAAVLSTSL
jgi:HlyD family secretion protein